MTYLCSQIILWTQTQSRYLSNQKISFLFVMLLNKSSSVNLWFFRLHLLLKYSEIFMDSSPIWWVFLHSMELLIKMERKRIFRILIISFLEILLIEAIIPSRPSVFCLLLNASILSKFISSEEIMRIVRLMSTSDSEINVLRSWKSNPKRKGLFLWDSIDCSIGFLWQLSYKIRFFVFMVELELLWILLKTSRISRDHWRWCMKFKMKNLK